MNATLDPFAFPVSSIDGFTQHGMTLRDYFAGQALQAILLAAGIQSVLKGEEFRSEPICHDAYQFADAMLAERGE